VKRARVQSGAAGWTLVEVTVAAALLVPLLLVLAAASRAVTGSLAANEHAAETSEVLVQTVGRVERILRAGRNATLRVEATPADVAAGRASTVGSWFPMPPLTARPGIDLWSTTGELGPELVVPSRQYRLTLVLDGSETRNGAGADDDADGLIDEGRLQLASGADVQVLIDGVEQCTFERDGDVLRFAMTCGRKGPDRRLRRTAVQHTIEVRNP
jgi:hypothetical protein